MIKTVYDFNCPKCRNYHSIKIEGKQNNKENLHLCNKDIFFVSGTKPCEYNIDLSLMEHYYEVDEQYLKEMKLHTEIRIRFFDIFKVINGWLYQEKYGNYIRYFVPEK